MSEDAETRAIRIESLRWRERELRCELEDGRAALAQASDVEEAAVARAKRENARRTTRALFGALTLGLGLVVASVALRWVPNETLAAHVEASERGPAEVGEECEVRISPALGISNATLEVDCSGQRLFGYGRFGKVTCETGGAARVCRDEDTILGDGDPRALLDRDRGALVLDDGDRWRLELALDE